MTSTPITSSTPTIPSTATATSTSTATDVVDRFLGGLAADGGVLGADVLAPDVELDATVPMWRLGATGHDAVRDLLASWFADPTTWAAVQRRPFPGGEVVEVDVRWIVDGATDTGHQLHVLEIEHDRIRRDTVFCGGRWPAALVAEMEADRAR